MYRENSAGERGKYKLPGHRDLQGGPGPEYVHTF